MGWAKYFEDNQEIMCERQEAMQAHTQEPEIRIVCTGILPTAKLVVEVKTEKHIAQIQKKYEDRYIICKDCGRIFLFASNAQKYYEKMGWDNPKRCKSCREYRNAHCLMHSSF